MKNLFQLCFGFKLDASMRFGSRIQRFSRMNSLKLANENSRIRYMTLFLMCERLQPLASREPAEMSTGHLLKRSLFAGRK